MNYSSETFQNEKWKTEQNPVRKEIIDTILTKSPRVDRNGKDYLLLETKNQQQIYVFSELVKNDRWGQLIEGWKFCFIIKPGKFNKLVDFILA